jgi:hypothetical protein
MSAATELPRPLPTLPTDEEIAHVEWLFQASHDAVEDIEGSTRRFSQLFEGEGAIPDVLPTHADVGRTYLFAHYLDTRGWELAQMSKEIIAALPLLGGCAIQAARGRSGLFPHGSMSAR